MKNNNISVICGLAVAVFLLVLPHSSSAYFTTAQSAQALTSHTGLFTIEYAFGLNDQDIYMPVAAQRGIGTSSSEKAVGYSLQTGSSTQIAEGNSAAIVVADLPIVNGMYKIAKGAAEKMTLLVLYTAPDAAASDDYELQVDKLPFYVDYGNGALVTRQLNPSELQYYVTHFVNLSGK